MDTTREIYLHIGLHKTGSTYLQNVVFPKMKLTSVCALVGRQIQNFGCELFGNKFLISEENLSGCPYANYPPRALDISWSARYEAAVRNLAKLVPDACIIMGVREHGGWLLSLYKQYLHQGGLKPFASFFDITELNGGVIKQTDLFLQPRIELLNRLFDGRLFVYNSADLIRERGQVIQALCDFVGEEPPEIDEHVLHKSSNKGVGHYQAGLLRALNHVDRTRCIRQTWTVSRVLCQKVLADWPKRKLQLPDDVRDYIGQRYRSDWDVALKAGYNPYEESPPAHNAKEEPCTP